jgi:thioredoxin
MNKFTPFFFIFRQLKLTAIMLSAFFLLPSHLMAQNEKKPEMLTKETFIKKVWDYKANPNEVKYLGDKPCMIDFYADWCGPCRRIAPFMEELSKAYAGEIYVYKINTDQQKELAALFQARSIPMVIFIPMKGQPQATRGALPKEQYEQLIKKVLLEKKEVQKSQKE